MGEQRTLGSVAYGRRWEWWRAAANHSLSMSIGRYACLPVLFARQLSKQSGGFGNDLGVTGTSGIGSVEDADIEERLWQAGFSGLNPPHLVLSHRAPSRRMTRVYFRRWHAGHGRFRARLGRCTGKGNGRHFLRVPASMYRQAIRDGIDWVRCMLHRDWDAEFRHEHRLRFFGGFLQGRVLERERIR